MSYQATIPQAQVQIQAVHVLSKWWWISLLISWVILIIVASVLIGISVSTVTNDYFNNGEFYGAIACFAIGGILKIAFWIVLAIWFNQRRRSRQPQQLPVVLLTTGSYVQQPAYPQTHAPAPVPDNLPRESPYCGYCGTANTTPFCTKCGAQMPEK